MQRKTLLASALALLVAGSASFAIAQDAKAPPPAAPATAAGLHAKAMRAHHGAERWHDMRGRRMHGGSGAIADLRELERLYLISGRSKDLPALYNDVLGKSQDPGLRNYAYRHLARAQARPTNVDQAIATLRKSLDENLANEAKRRAEFEKMRAQWQQRRAGAAPAAAPAGN
ncbi:hypothetical protein ASG87_08135 [Frateuria sp. Soil773]|uniref:hypothetical protein n=1 Tax=Frateuria sp. Soil773 TaxID=1736407 RepID=UPI0006F2FA19|nr:hypothetical protein [Frateuria sp. Soil773]KRE88544.1 hypothetical protein ASG87_08135 [Frateuria sp. Soil773]